jgi:hypothetical protein
MTTEGKVHKDCYLKDVVDVIVKLSRGDGRSGVGGGESERHVEGHLDGVRLGLEERKREEGGERRV